MACNQRLKILCLHGYRQDSEFFRDKIGGFRKSIKNIADLVFIDAPHVIPETSVPDACLRSGRAWWFSTETDNFNAKMETDIAKGFQASIDCVAEAFQSQGPFHGILGFSQGASLVSLICGLKELEEFPYDFKFAILIAGFKSISKCHDRLYEKKSSLYSLHIIGNNDQCIPKELSEGVVSVYHAPRVIYHDGGHFLPTQSTVRTEYVSFLKHMLDILMKDM